MRLSVYAAACIAAAVFLGACTSTVRTAPENIEIGSVAVSSLPPRAVTLVNGYASESELRLRSE